MSLTLKTAVAVGAATLPLLSILALSGPASATTPDGVGGRLTVRVDDGAGRVATYELVCGADGRAGGTHPDPQGACERLEAMAGPVGPVADEGMCPMIYGGPQTALVTGTWGSAVVQERYSRTNGCETDRWRRMVPVLPGA